MREFFTIAIFKIKADIRMNKTPLNSQKEKHSMLSLRRATHKRRFLCHSHAISIHALLAESDTPDGRNAERAKISIHALLAESDGCIASWCPKSISFLSTLSLRRATSCGGYYSRFVCNFYPRSPCGERRWFMVDHSPPQSFLSTLSLRRATPPRHRHGGVTGHFYPRSPCGERLSSLFDAKQL